MDNFHIIDLVKPFQSILPEIIKPQTKIPFKQKVLWTGTTLLLFLVMSQIPLYGVLSSHSSGGMMVSNRGTLMELGVSPMLTTSYIFQFLTAINHSKLDMNLKADRDLYQNAEKLAAIVLSCTLACSYVYSGQYGSPSDLGTGICIILVIQLVTGALLVILLDELLQKGYGLGSGTNLFMATATCEHIIWKCFSPTTFNKGRGPEFEGAIVNLCHILYSWPNKHRALLQAFFRPQLPNIMNVLATVTMFCSAIYLHNFRVNIPIKSRKSRGVVSHFPIKLFYAGTQPLMVQSQLTEHFLTLSQFLFRRFETNFLVRLFGTWEGKTEVGSRLVAKSGVAYLLSPPHSVSEALANPVHSTIYLSWIIGTCAIISRNLAEVNGNGPRDVTKRLKEQGLVMRGHRDTSMYREVKRIIPTACAVGGAMIALLSFGGDIIGTIGSGPSILIAVGIIYGYAEMAEKEGGMKNNI